jgi:hypothetical protein
MLDLGMRPEKVAEATGWSVAYVRKLIRTGQLDARKVGRTVIVMPESVRALQEAAPRIGGAA